MDGPALLPLLFARACGGKFLLLVPVPFFFSWLRVLARAVGPWSCLFVERSPSTRESAHISLLSSTTRKGEQGPRRPARSPDTARTRRSARLFATIRPERVGLPGRRGKGSRDSFSLFFYGFCVNACGKAPVGDKIESFKCCRVSRNSGYFFCCIVPCAYKYLHSCKSLLFFHVLLNVLLKCSRFTPSSFPCIDSPSCFT